MNYDASVFKEKANRKARIIWLIFSILLSANYGSDTGNGLYPVNNYIIFLILCWLPVIIGEVMLRVKGWTTDIYKHILIVGYGIFYTFVDGEGKENPELGAIYSSTINIDFLGDYKELKTLITEINENCPTKVSINNVSLSKNDTELFPR